MTKKEECVAQEREEIATRIAKFKATQQKFEREVEVDVGVHLFRIEL